MKRRLCAAGWLLMAVVAGILGLASLRYFTLNPAVFFERQRDVYAANPGWLLLHTGGGIVALCLGPWQFWSGFRDRSLRRHRILGRIYLGAVATGGAGGLGMAALAYGGLPARAGFGSLALLWLGTAALAYARIARGEIERHREWMMRNYTLTFAAVTLRLWVVLLESLGIGFEAAYVAAAWLSWVLNLLAVEIRLAWGRRGRAAHPGWSAG